MNWNKTGKNIRKTIDNISNIIFGAMNTSELLDVETHPKAQLPITSYSHRQIMKTVWEFEFKKSRAIEFVRRFQNC